VTFGCKDNFLAFADHVVICFFLWSPINLNLVEQANKSYTVHIFVLVEVDDVYVSVMMYKVHYGFAEWHELDINRGLGPRI
jgi:hypothetical protein